jgi:preprotein translocase subunit SecG
MIGFLMILHLVVCIALVAVVLLQAGRGGGLSGAFGGGGGQALFGGRGAATFLSKATVVLGAIFFVSSLSLAFLATKTRGTARSLVQEAAKRAAPAGPPTTGPRPAVPPAGGTQGGGATPSGGAPGSSTPSGTTPSNPPPKSGTP